MDRTSLGQTDISIPRMGLGCMGMAFAYGDIDIDACKETLEKALEIGVNFWDTSDFYGFGENERFLGEMMKGRRDNVVIATKCGIVVHNQDPRNQSANTRPEHIKSACEASLRRLKVDEIDLFYLHRLDGETPLEDSMGALADLFNDGKIRAAGLSEVSATTIKAAHATFPVAAVQNEYSLMSRAPVIEETIDTCLEIGASFVPYSPICRGLLTNAFKSHDAFSGLDYRRILPRFQEDAMNANLQLIEKVADMAAEKGVSPVQLSLAWVLSRAPNIVPIPGTRKAYRLEENAAATKIPLTQTERDILASLIPLDAIQGERYPEFNNLELR